MEGNILQLVGILIIIVGFALKLDVLAVVLISGVVTGLISGLNIVEILEILGKSFVNTRVMSAFLIVFPTIAILERYGLKERAAKLITSMKRSSSAIVMSLYMFIRSLAAAFNVRLGGHVQFIRPLILPMSEAAAEKMINKPLSEKQSEKLKGLTAAIENYGNFFAQNVFSLSAGVILMQGVLSENGFNVELAQIAIASIPVMIISIIVTVIQVHLFDRQLKKEGK